MLRRNRIGGVEIDVLLQCISHHAGHSPSWYSAPLPTGHSGRREAKRTGHRNGAAQAIDDVSCRAHSATVTIIVIQIQEEITMFVIDPPLRFSQHTAMFDPDTILDELKRQIRNQSITNKEVATMLHIAPPRVTEMLKGERKIQAHEMPILARALRMEEVVELPVVGYVGAGGEVVFEDAYPLGGSLYDVFGLPSLGGNFIGLEIRGDSMWPVFREGNIVFIRRDGWDHVEDDALNDWAVCRLDDGRTLLKEVRRSATPGTYDLISQNASPIMAVDLVWATPVEGYRRR